MFRVIKLLLSSFFFVNACNRVEEHISQGEGSSLVDPDRNFLYTKRKRAKQGASCNVVVSSAGDLSMQKIKFPESGWGTQLLKMPLFTKAEMNNYIENSGKLLGRRRKHSSRMSI